MSQAWIRLRAAVHVLGQDGSPRERLSTAFSNYLLGLKPKEVPSEIRADFIRLQDWAHHTQRRPRKSPPSSWLAQASDNEVTSMIDLIIDMYDAVTRYEPILAKTGQQRSGLRPAANDLVSAA